MTPFYPRAAIVLTVFLSVLLSACAAGRDDEAPAAYLKPTGWQDISSTLEGQNYQDYSARVGEEVQRYRIPFDPDQTELEIERASPVEIMPTQACGDSVRGIAILVHGLSDTAYTMRDMAQLLADNCFVARSILLPGHGTRAGDLLTTRYKHWAMTIRYLIDQAATENETVIVAGFSLGAVLTLEAALQPDSPVDAVLAFSPAYYLSSYKLARFAPWVHPVKPWIDRGRADDAMRYEAMPTRGVAETVKAMKIMHKSMRRAEKLEIPWLLVQSNDDAVVIPKQNSDFFEKHAAHASSTEILFYSEPDPDWGTLDIDATIRVPVAKNDFRVLGLTHVSPHVSPSNPHYGISGSYRNCGSTAPRDQSLVVDCSKADEVWYGLWQDDVPAAGQPRAIAT